jgi:spermidine/putrescine transport system permease protein
MIWLHLHYATKIHSKLMGYEILPLRIYSMVRVGLKPEVNALGTLLLVFSLAMLMLSQWILTRSKR